ncbi:signal peptidase I [Paenibacillus harenae]|uniref:signal peptidase I n=1 Tax=Paenibacillus harenae TaxID=306543 RepID=UPI000686CE47|nr:signal peptidase I [Paenibacillus harenae]
MRQQSNDALFQLLARIMQRDGRLVIPAKGSSMFPLIREGNLCRFRPVMTENIRKGDIILFSTESGQLIAHRLLTVMRREERLLYICKGDTNLGCDEPIRREQMLGVLYSIRKARKELHMSDRSVSLWTKAVIALPIISQGLNRYLSFQKTRSANGVSL